MKNFYAKIREIRESKKLSQEYMAHQLGISTISYHKLETGKTQLTLERLQSIAQILDTNLTEILGATPKTEIKEYHSNYHCSINGDIVSANDFLKIIQDILAQNQALLEQNKQLIEIWRTK
ncbi:MAG: helix-turn-helix domain-containing protein [Thermonemataceae bacterium]|nr:helix-turn-helix domain-containing protein [Thermonemataceae bacterium]